MDSPASFVRRTMWGGLAIACAVCGALAAFGMGGWAGGVAAGAAVALGNFWLLGRAVVRLGDGVVPADAGERAAGGGGGARALRVALRGTALRLVLAALVLGVAIAFLPIHPLGVAAGLVGVHAGMTALWLAAALTGNGS